MSANVSIARNSVHVQITKIEPSDECFNLFDYKVEALQDHLHEAFPSVYACLRWLGKEDCAIAYNNFAYFGVSERNGIVSVWVTPKQVKSLHIPIRDKWIRQIGSTFTKVTGKVFT